uniref:Uncharacterized protein n=1 Tax=Arundo donax TaxID=35708 RepID=A0A0A9DY56_ARUDO
MEATQVISRKDNESNVCTGGANIQFLLQQLSLLENIHTCTLHTVQCTICKSGLSTQIDFH